MTAGSTYKQEKHEEVALLASANGKRCNQCGKIGHIARNCNVRNTNRNNNNFGRNNNYANNKSKNNRYKNNNNNGNNNKKGAFNGECFHCKKFGHKKEDWYKYQRAMQQGNRPKEQEFVLCTMDDSKDSTGYEIIAPEDPSYSLWTLCWWCNL